MPLKHLDDGQEQDVAVSQPFKRLLDGGLQPGRSTCDQAAEPGTLF